jgi:hypothetical protein
MSECLTVKWTVLTILLCLLRLMSDVWCLMSDVWCLMSDVWCLMSDVWCLMSDVWSILYLTTKDVGLYSLCPLSFILTYLMSSIFISSCFDALARLVLARFSSHDHMSDWPFRNFLKLSSSSRHMRSLIKRCRFLTFSACQWCRRQL